MRDPITKRDGVGRFPGLNELAADTNRSPERYAAAYNEYEALVGVFRAYLVAVHVRKAQPLICQSIPKALLDAEKVASPLPVYYPTDFSMTYIWYEYTDGKLRRAMRNGSGLFHGGVSIGATKYRNSIPPIVSATPIIAEIKAEALKPVAEPTWKAASGRHFIAFTLDLLRPKTASATPQKIAAITRMDNHDFGPPIWNGDRPISTPPADPTAQGARQRPKELRVAERGADTAARSGPPGSKAGGVFDPTVLIWLFSVGAIGLLVVATRSRRAGAPKAPVTVHAGAPNVPDSKGRYPNGAWAMPDQSRISASYNEAERAFKSVFAMKSMADREALIAQVRKVHGGTREQAMQRAVQEWQRDNRSWRG
jgi:hypothetical protein